MTELNIKSGKVVTFYSFKGGVGRTMSLVNVACLLALKNKKVLLIDWDLEAPGLHTFFKYNIKSEHLGLVDFIKESIDFHNTDSNLDEKGIEQFITNNIDKYICKNVLPEKKIDLDIIKAGKFDSNYSVNLNAIEWLDFYKSSPYFFNLFASVVESKYDYIFIDSRTGLSDTGGICTMLMPQILVLVFALNEQNISGVIDIAKQSIEYRFESNDLRNLNILPLPSRIDDNQKAEDLQFWIKNYSTQFEGLFKDVYLLDECYLNGYFDKAKIPYKSEHAYGEKIPVLTEPTTNDLFISYHYQQFTNLLQENRLCWEVLTEEQLEESIKIANETFREGLKHISSNKLDEATLSINRAKKIAPSDDSLFYRWAENLVSIAWNEVGKKSEFLYKHTFDLYQMVIDLKPDDYDTFNNWGVDLGNFAQTKAGKEAEQLYEQAFEKFQQAIKIKPDNFEALYNWGLYLGRVAEIKTGKDREELYRRAFEKFQQVIEIRPTDQATLNNWGINLGKLAQTKMGQEAEELYEQAVEKLQKAIEYGESPYNLSCLYALKGEKEKAFFYLNTCLSSKQIGIEHVEKDDDWKDFFNDEDFKNLLDNYRKNIEHL